MIFFSIGLNVLDGETVRHAESIKYCELSVYGISIDPKQPETIYAMVDGKNTGVHKSMDSGESWRVVMSREELPSWFLAINPSNNLVIYTGQYKSTNGGATWSRMSNLPVPRHIIINTKKPSVLYSTTYRDIYKTSNGGAEWSKIEKDLGECRLLSMDAKNPDVLYAYCTGVNKVYKRAVKGIYKSTDGGDVWNVVLPTTDITTLTVSPNNSAVIYAGNKYNGVYRSMDGGNTWNTVKHGLPDNVSINALVVDPVHSGTVYIGTTGKGVFKSIDHGLSWKNIGKGFPKEDTYVLAMAINPQFPNIIYIGIGDSGIYKSTDGGENWMPVNNGIACREIELEGRGLQ
jgi:photosystem II stability/assembly factor-like uncharacterized protein